LLPIWTAVRLYRHRDEDPDIQDNPLFRATRRILPASDTYADGKLIARVGGRRVVTPLFIVFVTIGGTDILFALDSIPAVFGVTDQPYIVFVANAFALLGLRGAVLPGDRSARPAGVPVERAGADSGVHRREADPALGSRA
jgi:predicted tellurium resistance membrane protein TerC